MTSLTSALISVYQLLSRFKRKIFKYIHGLLRTYIHAFPSLITIANNCGCSVKTVQRAIDYFVSVGFISYRTRPYQSNVYFMDDDILKLNLDDPNLFLKKNLISDVQQDVHPNVQQDVHVLDLSINQTNIRSDQEEQKVDKVNYGNYKFLLNKRFSPREAYLLAKYPEHAVQMAYENCQWYEKVKGKIQKPFFFLQKTIQNLLKS
jgi:hypothetical protein